METITEIPFEVKWKEAMTWWKESNVETYIRNIASKRLSKIYEGTGQGISSSDINHQVFSMHQEFKRGNYNDIITYLLDAANEIS